MAKGDMLQEGERAVLVDLQSKPELNGREVELLMWLEERGRWRCRNPVSSGTINVRPENLEPPKGEALGPPRAGLKRLRRGRSRREPEPQLERRRFRRVGKSRSDSPPREPERQLERRRFRRVGKTSTDSPPRTVPVLAETGVAGGLTEPPVFEDPPQTRARLEGILRRPDLYVGSPEKQCQEVWVLEDSAAAPSRASSSTAGASASSRKCMALQKLDFAPALYRLYDEILVNAADQIARAPPNTTLRVKFDAKLNTITVWHNGRCLPLEPQHGCHVPDLLFGRLLATDPYVEREEKFPSSCRNSFGVKLANIFSRHFSVEIVDTAQRKRYRQSWRENMTERGEPEVLPLASGEAEDFTCVTFEPDLARFGMTSLEDDVLKVMSRRAYDLAACTRGRCQVFLNDELLRVRSWSEYVGLYLQPNAYRYCEVCSDRWEVGIALSKSGGFRQVSLVNSIFTSRGGAHVAHVADLLVDEVMEHFGRQGESGSPVLTVKPQPVRNHLWVFVNCLIDTPTFDSQLKDALATKCEAFGSRFSVSDKMREAVLGSGIVDATRTWSKAFNRSELARHLNRSDNCYRQRIFGVPGLEDAKKAGTRQAQECTLIIADGNSAAALAVSCLNTLGRDCYGVFSLRGGFKNVRAMTPEQIVEDEEIDQLAKALALDATRHYTDAKGLRYGAICILTDQDDKGSYLKGLVISFLQLWFPGLLQVQGFLRELVLPVIVARRGEEEKRLFSEREFEAWKTLSGEGWDIQRFAGLGSCTAADVSDYFCDVQRRELTLTHSGSWEEDDFIDVAFSPNRTEDRKRWIMAHEEASFVDRDQPMVSCSDLFNKELVLHHKGELMRAVPNLMDGLLPLQRKVLCGAFQRKLNSEITVEQLSGFISSRLSPLDGEDALQETIVQMAQDFVGSNNLNLLQPIGQFGTRHLGGKDHAAAEHLYTMLSPMARKIFPQWDDEVLDYLCPDGAQAEPRWYCPVVPLVLINGAEGSAQGWSTSVPKYSPRDVVANVRHHLRGQPLEPMTPWYRGFQGSIVPDKTGQLGKFESVGVAVKRGPSEVDVTELPVGRWTQDYKELLLEMALEDPTEKSIIADFQEGHSDDSVHFGISLLPEKAGLVESEGFERSLRLKTGISTTNMLLLDSEGELRRFDSPEHVISEFAKVRLELYSKRKEHHTALLERQVAILNDQARFVKLVADGLLDVSQRTPEEVFTTMRRFGLRTKREIYAGDTKVKAYSSRPGPKGRNSTEKDEQDSAADLLAPMGFEYLLKIPCLSLTEERFVDLQHQLQDHIRKLNELRDTGPERLWERDLASLEELLGLPAEGEGEVEADSGAPADDKGNAEGDPLRPCVLVFGPAFGDVRRVLAEAWSSRQQGTDGQLPPEKRRVDDLAGGGISAALPCVESDMVLAFTENGYVQAFFASDVPLRPVTESPVPINELVPIVEGGHRITAVMTLPQGTFKTHEDDCAVLVTALGVVKKVALPSFRALRRGRPSSAVQLDRGDELRFVHRASFADALVVASARGNVLCLPIGMALPSTGLRARGKLAVRLLEEDWVAACVVARHPDPNAKQEMENKRRTLTPYQLFARERGVTITRALQLFQFLTPEEQQKFKDMAVEIRRSRPESTGAPTPRFAGALEDCEDNSDEEMVLEPQDEAALSRERHRLARRAESAGPFASLCALLVTRLGMGKRVRIGDVGFRRRYQAGRRCIRLQDDDTITSMCIVPGDELPGLPPKPRSPEMLYQEQQQEELKVLKRQQEIEHQEQERQLAMAPDDGNALDCVMALAGAMSRALEEATLQIRAVPRDPSHAFSMLTDAERAPFLEVSSQEQEAYREAVEARRQLEPELRRLGQLLVSTASGASARVRVSLVEVQRLADFGQRLIEVQNNDEVISACLILPADEESEDGQEQAQEEGLQAITDIASA